jgi:hypothetical protein
MTIGEDGPQGEMPADVGGSVLDGVEIPATGDPGLDEALRELARASAISLEDQLPVIEAVHRSFQDRLADTED